MLVLSRKVGERIIINENIVVTVMKTKGQRVCLAIEAPLEVPIRRSELSSHQRADPSVMSRASS